MKPKCRLCDAAIRSVGSLGLCHTHYERWTRWGKPPIEEWVAAFQENRLLTCEICDRGFNGYPNRSTCSEECDMERRRRRALASWHAKSAEARRQASLRAQERGRQKREATKVEHTCPICGKPFTHFPYRIFCGPACRREETRRRQAEIRARISAVRSIDDRTKLEDRFREEE